MAVAAKDYIGRILSGYRLVALLGAGGAGAVFLGERLDDTSIQRAIKVLLPGNELPATEMASFQARFLREAQAASQLRHAHILPILSYHAEASGLSYMELPLMIGGTLASRITDGPLPLDDIASYLRQIASALDYAHRQGVIHRDVKGVNVLLDENSTAFLADFGIARIFEQDAHGVPGAYGAYGTHGAHGAMQPLDTTGSQSLTRTGQVIGTPACMAPEQFTGGAITPQLDIYALGVLAWQLVTGSLPFVASDPLQLALQHINTPPPSARARRQELPEPAEAALNKALAKQPEDRFASAGIFATAFSDGLHGDWHPALSEPTGANHTLDTTLATSAIAPGILDASDVAHPDGRTRLATRKLPENQPPKRRRIGRVIATSVTILALIAVVVAGVVYVPRVLPSLPPFARQAATVTPSPSPTVDPLRPLVPTGRLIYTTNAPGPCDSTGAQWFMNSQGQQQCVGGGTTLVGSDCPCPLALAKLQRIPGVTFPDDYVMQAQMQSIGASRTDYFGFKFREQATTPDATNFGGYSFMVNANGEWEFNKYAAGGARILVDSGELRTPLLKAHTYDVIVQGSTYTFVVDGQTIATETDTTFSGGIVDFAAEPRCVVFITAVTLYAAP